MSAVADWVRVACGPQRAENPSEAGEHQGSRVSYLGGCRCHACRAANVAYLAARPRRKSSVPAGPARAHLEALQSKGIGLDQAARESGVSRRIVYEVRSGARVWIRPETSAALLAVRPVLAHGAIVPAWHTRRLLRALRSEGFTSSELAWRLGNRSRRLNLTGRSVRVATALKVRRLYRVVTAEGDEQPAS
jgi:hypothetical protein